MESRIQNSVTRMRNENILTKGSSVHRIILTSDFWLLDSRFPRAKVCTHD